MNLGVVAIQQNTVFTQGEEQFWETFISQISGKFEREYLRSMAKQAFLLNESDKLYKTLFNSISHELRIPVATIMGASDSLLTTEHSGEIRKELFDRGRLITLTGHVVGELVRPLCPIRISVRPGIVAIVGQQKDLWLARIVAR